MKVSARNVFEGNVKEVREGAVNAEVILELAGGTELVAVVTMESVTSLGLEQGARAIALVKAPWVMVLTEASGVRLSARNCLAGTVETVSDGAVNAEVTIATAGGSKICAVVTRDAVQELQLEPGVSATAVFKASHVILGVPA